jgi:two-component system, OmpR family, sensor histidine kinase KdpD
MRSPSPVTSPRPGSAVAEYARAVAIIGAISLGCLAARARLTTTDVAMLLLLGVVLVASRYRRGPAVLASLVSIAAFNFLFVPPYYTFDVHDAAYFLTFAVMLVVALTMSRLTGVVREYAIEAERRERRAAALAALNADLTGSSRPAEVVEHIIHHVARVVTGRVAVVSAAELDLLDSPTARLVARTAHEEGRATGLGTGRYEEDADGVFVPLRTAGRQLGLISIWPETPEQAPAPEELQTVEALAAQGALVLERAVLGEQNETARAEAEAERLRTALLSSLSHDLRTPLGTIEGAATGLLEENSALGAEGRREYADTILQESRRMTRLVSNLLNMIRVETGALAVTKSWQPLEEALGVALLRVESHLDGRTVEVDLPPNLPLVPIDELLIEQVFINLLENAAKYTPADTPISVSAAHRKGEVWVEVADQGPGVPPGEEDAVFRKFYRAETTVRAQPGGAGLGLTIARGIVLAHGGRMWVENRHSGGATFVFTLPLTGPPAMAEPEPATSDG